MPYIARPRRESFLPLLQLVGETRVDTAGELNYLITMLMKTYIEQHGKNFRIMNEISGAIETAKYEFMRRVLAPHEEEKIIENGDVF